MNRRRVRRAAMVYPHLFGNRIYSSGPPSAVQDFCLRLAQSGISVFLALQAYERRLDHLLSIPAEHSHPLVSCSRLHKQQKRDQD